MIERYGLTGSPAATGFVRYVTAGERMARAHMARHRALRDQIRVVSDLTAAEIDELSARVDLETVLAALLRDDDETYQRIVGMLGEGE